MRRLGALDGRRVLVVGASRGIGAAVVAAARAAGARVAGVARRRGDVTADVALVGDVRDPHSCAAFVESAVAALDGLDALVYCPAELPLRLLAETTPEIWNATWETNVRGAALVTAAALPALRGTGGRALYLSSDIVGDPRQGLGAYAVSKAALDQLVDCWRIEEPAVSFTRLTVGPTLTTIARGWDTELAQRLATEWLAAGWSPERVMTPEEVAKRVVDVLSDPAPPAAVDIL